VELKEAHDARLARETALRALRPPLVIEHVARR
jgi:hypothetical protein